MTRIDQFESVFKAATRAPYQYRPIVVERTLVVTDLPVTEAQAFRVACGSALAGLGDDTTWIDAPDDTAATVEALLQLVERERPDLICTYRSLHSEGWRTPFSLGEHLDVLTQATSTPILVMPRPELDAYWQQASPTAHVMALTDHLTGDAHLVDWSVRVTPRDGRLTLAHIEDQAIFERYIEAISRIPTINTDVARSQIGKQLLKEPSDYIETCRRELRSAGITIEIDSSVDFGHHLDEVERQVADRSVDLLVIETKDQDQMAMHGLAYPIAVELRDTPILML